VSQPSTWQREYTRFSRTQEQLLAQRRGAQAVGEARGAQAGKEVAAT
jgi:hypothetical protein